MHNIKVICQLSRRDVDAKNIISKSFDEFNQSFGSQVGRNFKPDFIDEDIYLTNEILSQYSFYLMLLRYTPSREYGAYMSGVAHVIPFLREYVRMGKVLDVFVMHNTAEKQIVKEFSSLATRHRNLLFNAAQIFPNRLMLCETQDAILYYVRSTLHRWTNIADARLDPPVSVIPEQAKQGYIFGGDKSSPFKLVDEPPPGLRLDEDQRQTYRDIKNKTEMLVQECGSSNRLAEAKITALAMLKAMGSDLEELQIRAFWSQMNSFRKRVEINDSDVPGAIRALQGEIVDNSNILCAYEPKLQELDEVSRDPSRSIVSTATLRAAAFTSHEAAVNRAVVTPETGEALHQMVANAEHTDASEMSLAGARAAQFSVRSSRNLTLEMMRRLYKVLHDEGYVTHNSPISRERHRSNSPVINAMGAYMVRCRAEIQALIEGSDNNKTLSRILKLIVDSFD